MTDTAELLALAERAARAAGALLAERVQGPVSGLAYKSSATDPVSDADRDAEATILAILREARPDDAMLGEEGTAEIGASGLRWVIDPLDGTVNYLYRQAAFCVSIACEDEQGGLVAVVHQPATGETFCARRGAGATRDGRPISVNRPGSLARALIATGFAYDHERRALQGAIVSRLLPQVRDIRRIGSAALDLAWVADGRLDGYYEHGLNAWDWAGGALLVQEAGGALLRVPAAGGLPEGLLAGDAATVGALAAALEGGGE